MWEVLKPSLTSCSRRPIHVRLLWKTKKLAVLRMGSRLGCTHCPLLVSARFADAVVWKQNPTNDQQKCFHARALAREQREDQKLCQTRPERLKRPSQAKIVSIVSFRAKNSWILAAGSSFKILHIRAPQQKFGATMGEIVF